MERDQIILRAEGINKSYPGVQALKDVDFDLKTGEVHILLGENGAGKSTFTQTIAGAVTADSGKIILDGQEVTIRDCLHAQTLGISMVYQESHCLPLLTVAENIYGGHEILGKGGRIDWAKTYSESKRYLEMLGCAVDPHALVSGLNLAERRMVEFAKALSLNSKVIILDEPTASLTAKETEQLFRVVRKLKEQNVGIIYISHRLGEVHEIGDRVTVFRNGQRVCTQNVKDVTVDQLIEQMIGRQMTNIYPWKERSYGGVALKADHISAGTYFEDVSFTLHEGEILGVSGLKGSGKAELLRALFGDLKITSGTLEIAGEPVKMTSPKVAIRHKIAYAPADRRKEGLNLNFDIIRNTTLASMKKFTKNGLLSDKLEEAAAQHYKDTLDIKTPSLKKMVGQLSGGNQQKVVLAKWLSSDARIIIFEEPTNGIDIGAKSEFHQLIADLAQQGVAVILMSSDLPELVGMSDRVIVLKEGRLVGTVEREDLTQERVLQMAT